MKFGTGKKGKGKAIPLQAWTGPKGSWRLRLPGFSDNRHMKVVMSALRTGRLYPQEISLVLISIRGWVDPRTGRIKSMKTPIGPVANRTPDHSACSAVPQPTAPPREAFLYMIFLTGSIKIQHLWLAFCYRCGALIPLKELVLVCLLLRKKASSATDVPRRRNGFKASSATDIPRRRNGFKWWRKRRGRKERDFGCLLTKKANTALESLVSGIESAVYAHVLPSAKQFRLIWLTKGDAC